MLDKLETSVNETTLPEKEFCASLWAFLNQSGKDFLFAEAFGSVGDSKIFVQSREDKADMIIEARHATEKEIEEFYKNKS